jgi:hypothetical protein
MIYLSISVLALLLAQIALRWMIKDVQEQVNDLNERVFELEEEAKENK